MDRGSWYCTGRNDQDYSQGKEMKNAKWLFAEDLKTAEKKKS